MVASFIAAFASVERPRHVLGPGARHANEGRDADLKRGDADLAGRLERQARVLDVHVNGIEAGRFRDPRDLDRAHQAHRDRRDDLAARELLFYVVAHDFPRRWGHGVPLGASARLLHARAHEGIRGPIGPRARCATISQSAAGRCSTAAAVRVKLIISKRRRQAMAPLRMLGAFAFALMAAFPVASALAAAGGSKAASAGDATGGSQRMDTGSALVQLDGEPLATDIKTKPAQGKKIDFNSAAVKSYRAQLNTLRNQFKKWLTTVAPKSVINGKFDIS